MSSLVLCPDCKRTLKVPETAVGKTIRCPACKALIPPVSEPGIDLEDADPDNPSPSRSVRAAPTPGTAPARPRSQPPRDEEPEDDIEPVEEKPIRKKSSARARPIRKKSSAGLIIGLVAGGAVVFLMLLGGGAGLFWFFTRNKIIPAAEWQAFSPPNSDCTVLMPGTPVLHTRTIGAIKATHYQIERKKENATFEVAFFDLPAPFLPPTILDDMAKGARDNALPLLKGTVSSQSSISLGDLPGHEDQIKLPTRGTFITRIYLAKVGNTHRVYMVMAGGNSIQPNRDDAARFFDSFKLTAPARPPTFAGAAGEGGPQPPVVNPPPANPQPNPPRTIPRPRPPQGPHRER